MVGSDCSGERQSFLAAFRLPGPRGRLRGRLRQHCWSIFRGRLRLGHRMELMKLGLEDFLVGQFGLVFRDESILAPLLAYYDL